MIIKRAAAAAASSQLFVVPTIFNAFHYCLFICLNINKRLKVECWFSNTGTVKKIERYYYCSTKTHSSFYPTREKRNVERSFTRKMRFDNGGLMSTNETTSTTDTKNEIPQEEGNDDNYYKKFHGKLYSPYHVSHNIIQSLVDLRSQARNQKNYSRADSILQQLESLSLDKNHTAILPGYKLSLKDTITGVTTWDIIPAVPFPLPPRQLEETTCNMEQSKENCTVLQLAHMALGLAIHDSSTNTTIDTITSSSQDFAFNNKGSRNLHILERAEKRLIETQGTDLYGRAAADAAFWFALSYNNPYDNNNSNESIYYNSLYDRLLEYLVHISTNELLRYGNRPSCAPKHILHIVERFAAAGLARSPSVQKLHNVAAECLELKVNSYTTPTTTTSDSYDTVTTSKKNYRNVIQSLRDGTFDMHSERPLLLLWKFSTKQRKQRSFADSAVRHATTYFKNNNEASIMTTSKNITQNASQTPSLGQDCSIDTFAWWCTHFDDPKKPLVIDVGCGMGISALGLASTVPSSENVNSSNNTNPNSSENNYGKPSQGNKKSKMSDDYFADCNFAGVDLSRLTIGYANGVAHRLGLRKKKVNFFVSSAEDFITLVLDSYPGKVKLVLIQFPTPFRFIESTGTNQDHESHEPIFSGNSQLPLNDSNDGFMVTKNLLTIISTALKHSRGHLLLQSNCEDVAVALRKMASQEAGFQCVDVTSLDSTEDHGGRVVRQRIPQRTERYVSEGGERAQGYGWSRHPMLPKRGSTETEIACEFNGTPIHRCLLTPLP